MWDSKPCKPVNIIVMLVCTGCPSTLMCAFGCRYYLSRHCAVCDELTHATKPLCPRCTAMPQLAAAVLLSRLNRLERQYGQLVRICTACGGSGGSVDLEQGEEAVGFTWEERGWGIRWEAVSPASQGKCQPAALMGTYVNLSPHC
jgi:hypothetical protein